MGYQEQNFGCPNHCAGSPKFEKYCILAIIQQIKILTILFFLKRGCPSGYHCLGPWLPEGMLWQPRATGQLLTSSPDWVNTLQNMRSITWSTEPYWYTYWTYTFGVLYMDVHMLQEFFLRREDCITFSTVMFVISILPVILPNWHSSYCRVHPTGKIKNRSAIQS